MKDKLINAFSKLSAHETVKRNVGSVFKVRMYQKAARALKNHNFNSYEEAENILRSVFKNPKKILSKVKEMYDSGHIQEVQNIKENKTAQAVLLLSSVPQIGPVKAKELVMKHNITTIAELKKNLHLLNDKQKLGLKYYDSLIDPKTLDTYRIPRSEIEKFDKHLKPIASKLQMSYSICGSYRRGAKESGDIDVLLTGTKNKLKDIVQMLKEDNILDDHFSSGKMKWLGMGKISTRHRRIDLMYISQTEFPFAQLYFTGSKEFNEEFRGYARTRGYTLNEHGLQRLTSSGSASVDYNIKTEKDIFEFLGVEYVSPENRVQGKFKLPVHTPKVNTNISIKRTNTANMFNSRKGVLLAEVYKNNIDPTGYIASEKFDGIRAIWTGRTLRSRTDKLFYAPKWFTDILPKDTALDGELYIAKRAFEETASVVMKKVPDDKEWSQIKFVVFDIPTLKIPFTERVLKIQQLVDSICTTLKSNNGCPVIAAKQTRIESKNHMEKLYKNIVNAGGEGLMLRKADSLYVQRRSKNLLKVKPTNDSEAIITDIVEGKGKDKGRMGAIQVHLQKNPNVRFKIGTGFDDKMRQEIWNAQNQMRGKVVTFGYKGLTKYGIPRHPAFIRFRKNTNL